MSKTLSSIMLKCLKPSHLAINMALHLSERSSLKSAVDSVPVDAIELVVKAIDGLLLKDLLKYIADEIVSDEEDYIVS